MYESIVLAGDAAHVISFGINIANHVDIVHLAIFSNGGEQTLILFIKGPYPVADGVAVAPERAAVLGDSVGHTAQGQP